MPLFLIASRFVNTLSRRGAAALLAFAAMMLVLGGGRFKHDQVVAFGEHRIGLSRASRH